jgi:hypothetical protein
VGQRCCLSLREGRGAVKTAKPFDLISELQNNRMVQGLYWTQ